MNIVLDTINNSDVFKLKGEIKVNLIPVITPQLARYIQTNPGKNLVLDMAQVDFIDSSTIRMLINLHKRLEPDGLHLCLLAPSNAVTRILADVQLDKVFTVYQTADDLAQQQIMQQSDVYRKLAQEENGVFKLQCTCPVCGSNDVHGYYADIDALDWRWEDNDLFPKSELSGVETKQDVFSLQPVVCGNCYMSSIDIAHFTVLSAETDNSVLSNLPETAKQHLMKNGKNRKKIMESCIVTGDHFFKNPRNKIATYYAYKLAESCARSMAATKMPAAPFLIGYINYLMIKYATNEQKDECIDNIRTWLSLVLTDQNAYRAKEIAQTYAILLMADLSLGKPKEGLKLLDDMTLFMQTLPFNTQPATKISSPFFWYEQAQRIEKKIAALQSA